MSNCQIFCWVLVKTGIQMLQNAIVRHRRPSGGRTIVRPYRGIWARLSIWGAPKGLWKRIIGGLADGPVQLAAKHGRKVVRLKAQGEYAEWGPAYLDLRTARHDK